MKTKVMTALLGAAIITPAVLAQNFQLIATNSPPGSSADPSTWRAVLRFDIASVGGTATPLANLPTTEVFDPAGVAFRTANDVYIGNRHGNVLGLGSISRFSLSPDGVTATFRENFTAPNMIGVHELAFNPLTNELFAASVSNGIFRFRFNGDATPTPIGVFATNRQNRGVAVHPNGLFIYASGASSQIFRFRLDEGGGITELPALSIPGAQNLHFFCVSPSARELYVADINTNQVFRFTILGNSDLIAKPSIPSPSPSDVSISPDGTELFTGSHLQGGITRFRLNASDTWVQTGRLDAPQMGGFAIYNTPFCLADIDDGSGTGTRDNGVTIDDLLYYLALFADGNVLADIDDGTGTAQPDGGVTIDDLLYFLQRYAAGC
jgi:hypothetical protein